MGRKKKFIDKKNSAIFHLLARDSSDADFTSADAAAAERVFVRVDNNNFSLHGFSVQAREHEDGDSASIFADAPDGVESDEEPPPPQPVGLPEHVRREIVELGLPDDGYNYLLHMREIKASGGGSYYHNSKAKLDQVSTDVKAFDASRVSVKSSVVDEEVPLRRTLYGVSERAVGVRIQKAVDPDVAALLDEMDSRFADADELEEDFVVQANFPDEVETAVDDVDDEALSGREKPGHDEVKMRSGPTDQEFELRSGVDGWATEKPRVRRLLDEQFDLLMLNEYNDNHENGDVNYFGSDNFQQEADEPISSKLNDSMKEFLDQELELCSGYEAPADEKTGQIEEEGLHAEVIQKCREYAEMLSQEKEDAVEVLEESSDDSEKWDCETIVSTYSNLDNHPGRIEAPHMRKRGHVTVADIPSVGNSFISLRGREKLPVGFLPHSGKKALVKVERNAKSGAEQYQKPGGAETKEEKKERKAAVKEERREARIAKKNLKGLYRCEAQRAQKVAATTGPCSVHLMLCMEPWFCRTLSAIVRTADLTSIHLMI